MLQLKTQRMWEGERKKEKEEDIFPFPSSGRAQKSKPDTACRKHIDRRRSRSKESARGLNLINLQVSTEGAIKQNNLVAVKPMRKSIAASASRW